MLGHTKAATIASDTNKLLPEWAKMMGKSGNFRAGQMNNEGQANGTPEPVWQIAAN